jgi:hypothetical protein
MITSRQVADKINEQIPKNIKIKELRREYTIYFELSNKRLDIGAYIDTYYNGKTIEGRLFYTILEYENHYGYYNYLTKTGIKVEKNLDIWLETIIDKIKKDYKKIENIVNPTIFNGITEYRFIINYNKYKDYLIKKDDYQVILYLNSIKSLDSAHQLSRSVD